MTIQEREVAVQLISEGLKEGPIELRCLPKLLEDGGLSRTVFAGPKKWLDANFPEFFVAGSNGHEKVLYSHDPLARFFKLLKEKFPATVSSPIDMTTADVLDLMSAAQLHPGDDPSIEDMAELLKLYPEYSLHGSTSAVQRVAPTPLSPETRYMYGISFINWKLVYACVSRSKQNGLLTVEHVREQIAHKFARALVDGNGLVLDGLQDETPRMALKIGYRADNGEELYCVFQANDKDDVKQAWLLSGVVYPNESDDAGLGAWLGAVCSSQTRLTYAGLIEQIEALLSLRSQLMPAVSSLLDTLDSGLYPTAVSPALVEYEQRWTALQESLEQFPTVPIRRDMNLADMAELLRKKNEVMDMTAEMVALFEQFVASISARMEVLQARAPQADLQIVRGLFKTDDIREDLDVFWSILQPYRYLRDVWCAECEQQVSSCYDVIAEHFNLKRMLITPCMLKQHTLYDSAIALLETIERTAERAERVLASREGASGEAMTHSVDMEALEQLLFAPGAFSSIKWLELCRDAFPAQEALRAVVLGELADLPSDNPLCSISGNLIPSAIADRVMAFCGDQDQVAEQYLLLGLATDRKSCVSRLLSLYRERQDESRFLRLWNSPYRETDFAVRDACYWLSVCSRENAVDWDEVEAIVSIRPETKKHPEYQEIVRRMADEQALSMANRRWIGLNDIALNPLESAIVDNDTDAVYALLESPAQLLTLGYDMQELDWIRQALVDGLPGGTDVYNKAVRLYSVQGNKNDAVESLLWSMPLTEQTRQLLFEIYDDHADYASLCWLVRKFSLSKGMAPAIAYAKALAATATNEERESFLMLHPEIWHQVSLLEGLSSSPWTQIYQRETAAPLMPFNAFELALVNNDIDTATSLLQDASQMAEWGYDEEAVRHLHEKMTHGDAPVGIEYIAVARRLEYYVGNYNRCLEKYLYVQFDTNTRWAIQRLYALAYAEQRYIDAWRYYETEPSLADADNHIVMYLWCLLHLDMQEKLLEQAQLHPECLRYDEKLFDAVTERAERLGMQAFSDNIRRVLTLLPKNAFESAVIQPNQAEMQRYVSDPEQLSAMGYSAENIARFKDRIGKPMPFGTDGYSVAYRMRLFFDDERAIPFLLNALEDDRSAKMLMDIYYSTQRWCELCALYRKYLPKGIWNPTFDHRYMVALSKSSDAEDCRLYLDFLQRSKTDDETTPAQQWQYLRCYISTAQEQAALQQMQRLLDNGVPYVSDVALNTFDATWVYGSNHLREQMVLFAAQFYHKNMKTLHIEQQKAILSLNMNLLREDPKVWISFLQSNDLEQIAAFLMCYFGYGVDQDEQGLQKASDAFFALLQSADEQYEGSIITNVTKFLLDHEMLEMDSQRGEQLLAGWLDLILSRDQESGLLRLETLAAAEYDVFSIFWKSVELTDAQICAIHSACFGDFEERTQWTAVYFARILRMLSKTRHHEEYKTVYSDRLIETFCGWIVTEGEDEADAAQLIVSFLNNTGMEYSQARRFFELCADCSAFYMRAVRNAVLARYKTMWPDITYSYLQMVYFYSDQEEIQQEVLILARELVFSGEFEVGTDSQSLQFVYNIVCSRLSPEGLLLLCELYGKAEKDDYVAIIRDLIMPADDPAQADVLRKQFQLLLEEQTIEWIEYHAKWWASLVKLQEEDHQTKDILPYLTDDAVSMQRKDSVLRLLLSNMNNASYIGCYQLLEKELSNMAYAKLSYIRALNARETAPEAVRDCARRKQYLYAIRLLLSQVDVVKSNAVFFGQSLGDIYTPEAMQLFPELVEYVPAVYRCIIKLNQIDDIGKWKNIGRAVDIAILTETEELFFEIFNAEYQNMYISFPNKSTVLIGNLVLRGQYDTAKTYMQKHQTYQAADEYDYRALLADIIGDCLESHTLSPENEILVRSIPIDGNRRSLESYGALVRSAKEDGRIEACARALYKLYERDDRDKALLSSCIQLYTVLPEEHSLEKLYTMVRAYLMKAPVSFIDRVGRMLAIVSACIPEIVSDAQLHEDCYAQTQDGEVLMDVKRIRSACIHFLADGNTAARKDFLIRAATGWWRIDETSIDYLFTHTELCTVLSSIHTAAYYSACIAAVVKHRGNTVFVDKVLSLFERHNYLWAREQAQAATQYSGQLCECIATLLDAPMDLPGFFISCLEQVVAQPDDDAFIKQITLLIAAQQHFLSAQYNDNMCSLKSMLDTASASRRDEVVRMIARKTIQAGGVYKVPQSYLDAGEYDLMVITAKELYEQKEEAFFKKLNEMYILLGTFMSESGAEKPYTLTQLMNMSTLLCQSKAYPDIERLLAACPAKWKLCLRSVQEMIQGEPQNVLTLLNNTAFQRHEGCYMLVYTFVNNVQSAKKWINSLRTENKKNGRLETWGTYSVVDLPAPSRASRPFFLMPNGRNLAELTPFDEFYDTYIAQMIEEDQNEQNDGQSKKTKPHKTMQDERALAGARDSRNVDVWSIPFVKEYLERYQTEMASDNEDMDEEQLKSTIDELAVIMRSDHDPQKRMEACKQLLVYLYQQPISDLTRECCVELGLKLFQDTCVEGLDLVVTEEARHILYSIAPCTEGLRKPGWGVNLKAYVNQCLESYANLSQYTFDCEGDALLQLCDVIASADRNAAIELRNLIMFTRKIGQKMRTPMTNAQRLEWLEQCVADCRALEYRGEARVKGTLLNLLNQELRTFRNKARVYLYAYNKESVQETPVIFGAVRNFGGESVTKLVLSLYVNDVFVQQSTLPQLNGGEMVPFSLPCTADVGAAALSYKLTLKYEIQDSTEETSLEDTLRLQDPEIMKNNFQRYDASNPADADNYVERGTINTILESNYLVDGGFRRFPNLAIYGMKRSGKSSILRRIGRLFSEHYGDSVYYVIVSCEGIVGDFYARAHSTFVDYVLDELEYKFDLYNEDGWDEFREEWQSPPKDVTNFRWLDSFYSALTHRWLPNKGLVVMIDEIERLYFELDEHRKSSMDEELEAPEAVESSNAQSTLWDVINKMSQREGSAIRFVLCGSDFFTSKIIAEGDNLTQFFQKGVKLNVERMEYTEIEEALIANQSVELHEDTIEYLWEIANGLPWHSKIFCNAVIENQLMRAENSKRRIIYPSDIQNAVDQILSTSTDIVSAANFGLMSLSPEEKLVVDIVAEVLDFRTAKISHEDLMDRINQVVKDESKQDLYKKSILSLVNERKLLKIDQERNYQLACELYRMYLRRVRPIRFRNE